jgi:hypothetical protein
VAEERKAGKVRVVFKSGVEVMVGGSLGDILLDKVEYVEAPEEPFTHWLVERTLRELVGSLKDLSSEEGIDGRLGDLVASAKKVLSAIDAGTNPKEPTETEAFQSPSDTRKLEAEIDLLKAEAEQVRMKIAIERDKARQFMPILRLRRVLKNLVESLNFARTDDGIPVQYSPNINTNIDYAEAVLKDTE